MNGNNNIQKIKWAFGQVLVITVSPIGPALTFWEVFKFMILPIAISVDLLWLQNWYFALSALAGLFLVAAIRIQLNIKTKQENDKKLTNLHDLRKEGVEIRNEGLLLNGALSSLNRPPLDQRELDRYDKKCLDWEERLISALSDSPKYLGFIVTLNIYNKIYKIESLNLHQERLNRLEEIIIKL